MIDFIRTFFVVLAAIIFCTKILPWIIDGIVDIIDRIIQYFYRNSKAGLAATIADLAMNALRYSDSNISSYFINKMKLENRLLDLEAHQKLPEYKFIQLISQVYIMRGFVTAMQKSYDEKTESFDPKTFKEFFTTQGFSDPMQYVEFYNQYVIEEYTKYVNGANNNLIFTPKSKLSEIITIASASKFHCTYFDIEPMNIGKIEELYTDIIQMEEQNGAST